MAEEIVERLKAEGQLTRNTGTNSIRAVRIQLDRFEKIFETISERVTLQTRLLADLVEDSTESLRIREETAERERARQQREDLAADQERERRDTITRDDLPNKVTREREGIFSLIKDMGLTRLLLGGAAATYFGIAGYNFLKGFIDEKTGGKFSDFEKGLIETVKNVDFNSISVKFNEFFTSTKSMTDVINDIKNSMSELSTNLNKINENIENVKQAVEEWKNSIFIQLAKYAGAVIGGTLLATALLGPRDFSKGVLGKLWERLKGARAGAAGAGAAGAGAAGAGAAGAGASSGGGRGTLGYNTPDERAQMREGYRNSRAAAKAGIKVTGSGTSSRFRDSSGKILSDEKALEMMKETINPKYAKVLDNLFKLSKKVVVVGLTVALYEIYMILSDDKTYPTDEDKMQAMAPILGSLFGGIGGASLGAAIGSIPPLTGWGTLIGGIAGGLLGAFAGNKLGYLIAKWAFGKELDKKDYQDIKKVKPRPKDKRAAVQWDRLFKETHDPETGMLKGFTGIPNPPSISKNTKNATFMDPNSKWTAALKRSDEDSIDLMEKMIADFANDRTNFDKSKYTFGNADRVSTVASGGINMPVTINHSVAPIVHNVQGGSNVTNTILFGSGVGDSSKVPYANFTN